MNPLKMENRLRTSVLIKPEKGQQVHRFCPQRTNEKRRFKSEKQLENGPPNTP
jgi:hypothetical protein